MYRSVSVLAAAVLAGCASGQLNFNTLDLAGSVGDLYAKQVLLNLSRAIDDAYAMPSQMDISGGLVQTNFSITPNATTPLNRQIVRGAGDVLTSTTLAGATASLNISDSAQQNWSVAPVTDANSLRNLRALYNYAVRGGNLSDYTPAFTVDDKNVRKYDPFFISFPHCVRCGPKADSINPMLGPGRWLYWSNDFGSADEHLPPQGADVIVLGHFGNHTLMVLRNEYKYFDNFVLFTMPVNEPSSGSSDKAAGGKGGGPRTPTRHPFSTPFSVPLPNPPQ
ncbi:MAG: hypothetical protein ACTHLO_01515 [Pseudolabrys sp.]